MKTSVSPEIIGDIDLVWDDANSYAIDKPFQTGVATMSIEKRSKIQAKKESNRISFLPLYLPAFQGGPANLMRHIN